MLKVTVLLLSVASVLSNDIRLGYTSPNARKLISEIKEADPALWRRTDDIIVNAPNNEIISAVHITDLREYKDGEAFIQSGGIGGKSVTVGLKSPSILRGYRFEVEVYSENPNSRYNNVKGVPQVYGDVQYARKF